jgi:hypothetical protein
LPAESSAAAISTQPTLDAPPILILNKSFAIVPVTKSPSDPAATLSPLIEECMCSNWTSQNSPQQMPW